MRAARFIDSCNCQLSALRRLLSVWDLFIVKVLSAAPASESNAASQSCVLAGSGHSAHREVEGRVVWNLKWRYRVCNATQSRVMRRTYPQSKRHVE